MDYYLEIKDSNDPILIGTISFGYFYYDDGFDFILHCIEKGIDPTEEGADIRDQMGNIISITNFISLLESVKMRKK